MVAVVREGRVHLEDGPADPYARRHESMGDSCAVASFIDRAPGWIAMVLLR